MQWVETEDAKEWDGFMAQNGGTIFHSWAWRTVLEDKNSKPFYMVCRSPNGEAIAACPFFFKIGRHLTYLDSLPASDLAGPIFSKSVSDLKVIVDSLRRSVGFSLLRPTVAMGIRVHQQEVIEAMKSLGFRYSPINRGLLVLDLRKSTLDDIWNAAFGKHDRQAVKYHEHNSEFLFTASETDYSSYLSLKELQGDHAYLFSRMRANMGDKMKVAVVLSNGEIIAGLTVLCDQDGAHLEIARHLRGTRNIHSVITYLDWKAIEWASKSGFKYVNFGSYPASLCTRPDNGLLPKYSFVWLKERFALTFMPWYRFTLPTSGLYSPVKGISRALRILNPTKRNQEASQQ